jgi:hypothetical protein
MVTNNILLAIALILMGIGAFVTFFVIPKTGKK